MKKATTTTKVTKVTKLTAEQKDAKKQAIKQQREKLKNTRSNMYQAIESELYTFKGAYNLVKRNGSEWKKLLGKNVVWADFSKENLELVMSIDQYYTKIGDKNAKWSYKQIVRLSEKVARLKNAGKLEDLEPKVYDVEKAVAYLEEKKQLAAVRKQAREEANKEQIIDNYLRAAKK